MASVAAQLLKFGCPRGIHGIPSLSRAWSSSLSRFFATSARPPSVDDQDVFILLDEAHDEGKLGLPLKKAFDMRMELDRDLELNDISNELMGKFIEADDTLFSPPILFEDNLEREEFKVDLLNEVLNELEDEPYCENCDAFHELEGTANCLGVYFAPGGFVGSMGDGIMPEFDPSHDHYRGYEWED